MLIECEYCGHSFEAYLDECPSCGMDFLEEEEDDVLDWLANNYKISA